MIHLTESINYILPKNMFQMYYPFWSLSKLNICSLKKFPACLWVLAHKSWYFRQLGLWSMFCPAFQISRWPTLFSEVLSNYAVQVFLVKDETIRSSKFHPWYWQSEYIFSEKEPQVNLQPLKQEWCKRRVRGSFMALGDFLIKNCALMLRKIPYILLYWPPLLENLVPLSSKFRLHLCCQGKTVWIKMNHLSVYIKYPNKM